VLVVGGARLRRSDASVETVEDLPGGHPVNRGPEPEVSGADGPVLVGDDGAIVLAGDRNLVERGDARALESHRGPPVFRDLTGY
jgi:hypothetical protein